MTATTAKKKTALPTLQILLLKKLKTYKTPKTSRELLDALTKNRKNPTLAGVQQVAASLRALEGNGYVYGGYRARTGGALEWRISGKGEKAVSK